MCYADHVNLGLFLGPKLKSHRLEGTEKGLKHIKARNESEINERKFDRLLKRAAALVE